MLEIYIGWGLLIPAALYLLRGYTSLRVIKALGYERKGANGNLTAPAEMADRDDLPGSSPAEDQKMYEQKKEKRRVRN